MSRASSVGTPNTGFRNVAVPNRNDRKAASDKEGLEKSRLAERKEGFQRWQDPGRVTEVSETGLGYAPASARYMTGAASELKAQRDAVIDDRERKYHRARLINLQKEEDRWQSVMQKYEKEARREERAAESSKGSHNHASVAYDTITLEYFPTEQGQKQKFEDDLLKYRAGVRTETLHRRGAGHGFNPITGEDLKPPQIPSKPSDLGPYKTGKEDLGCIYNGWPGTRPVLGRQEPEYKDQHQASRQTPLSAGSNWSR